VTREIHSPGRAAAPAIVDLFALFDLPRRFALDVGDLERRYLERARSVHPDRLIASGPEAQARGAAAAIDLNTGYRVLRSPARRAEHLLALEGQAIGDQDPVDGALLAEMLELREELEVARSSGDQPGLARLEAAMRVREQRELERAARALGRLETLAAAATAGPAGSRPARAEALAEAKAACIALRYVHRYLEAAVDPDEEGG
jgi:molecular chaperone HscB